jgi:sulfur carrier protein
MWFSVQPERRRILPFSKVPKVIVVNVNGAARRFEPDIDIAALLERLQLAGKRVAVERNGEIVPRSRFAQTALANGDRLEIVVAVGGG